MKTEWGKPAIITTLVVAACWCEYHGFPNGGIWLLIVILCLFWTFKV